MDALLTQAKMALTRYLLSRYKKAPKGNPNPLQIPELLRMILEHLAPADLMSASQVNSQWRMVTTPKVYESLCFHGAEDQKSVRRFAVFVNPQMTRIENLFTWSVVGILRYIVSDATPTDDRKGRQPYCQSNKCRYLRDLSKRSSKRSLVFPTNVGAQSHRFKGPVYGVIPYKSAKRFREQVDISKYDRLPVLQIHSHQMFSTWSVSRMMVYQTPGPFLKTLCITGMAISDTNFQAIVKKSPNLTSVYLGECPLITDSSIRMLALATKHSLTYVTLKGLNVTDFAMHHLSRHCPNIEYLDLTDTINVTDIGVRDILIMSPFLKRLELRRMSPGCGNGITEKLVLFVQVYGVSLEYLSIAGLLCS
jgi:hypothetical protein